MVKVVKENAGVSLGYMKIYEKERMLREIGHVEGRIEEIIRLFYRFGKSKEETIEELMGQVAISKEEALKYMERYSSV